MPVNYWTIGKVLGAAAEFLTKHNSSSPRLEAERLMAHTLNMRRIDLYLQYDRPLSQGERDAYRRRLRDRAAGTPLQYILGCQGFYRLVLEVNENVLIPRPETELLVEAVLAKLTSAAAGRAYNVLDVGTGSGAVAVAVAAECRRARLWALDISAAALEVAARNAAKYHLSERIVFFQSNLFARVKEHCRQKFMVIAANPPYIDDAEWKTLPADVYKEPRVALHAPGDGLIYYQRIIKQAKKYLQSGGWLALEVSPSRFAGVQALLKGEKYSQLELTKDYNGKERVVLASWRG